MVLLEPHPLPRSNRSRNAESRYPVGKCFIDIITHGGPRTSAARVTSAATR
jgi:hypothetical protein